jgi:hypothetical protein
MLRFRANPILKKLWSWVYICLCKNLLGQVFEDPLKSPSLASHCVVASFISDNSIHTPINRFVVQVYNLGFCMINLLMGVWIEFNCQETLNRSAPGTITTNKITRILTENLILLLWLLWFWEQLAAVATVAEDNKDATETRLRD